MDRFFTPQLSDTATTFFVESTEELRHLTRVLRLRPGHRAEFVDGKGNQVLGEICSVTKSRVLVRVEQRIFAGKPRPPYIILACAIPKNAKFEDIIDKCTQLGVNEIIPMLTERTEVVMRQKDIDSKCARFEKVAVSALKQSKRLWLPVISRPSKFADVLERVSTDAFALIPWLEGERKELKDILPLALRKKEVLIFIGPEGDFSPYEVQLAVSKGVIPVTLGPNVLRVDTAAALVAGAFSIFRG